MNKVAFTYVKTAVQLLGAPAWTAPVMYRMLVRQEPNGEIEIDEFDRKWFSKRTGLTSNAVNQAIFQLTKAGLLKRCGESRFKAYEDVFPTLDWKNVQKLELSTKIDTSGSEVSIAWTDEPVLM